MTLTNFKLSTLVSTALLTLSLNVFSTGTCSVDDNDEFNAQETVNTEYTTARNDGTYPETETEYSDMVGDNVQTLESNSGMDIAEVTGEVSETVDAAVETTSTALSTVSTAASAVGEVLGPVAIIITIGITVWQIATVFSNPNSTDLDKTSAIFSWVPILGTVLNIIAGIEDHDRILAAFKNKLKAINHQDHYDIKLEELQQDQFLKQVRVSLEQITNKDVAAVKESMVKINQKLSNFYQSQYLHNVSLVQTHAKRLFASQWVKASPEFQTLIEFIQGVTKTGDAKGAIVQVPTIISNPTSTLCGINGAYNFLAGKTDTQLSQCFGGILGDYKNHFASYNLDDSIQINTRDKVIDTTFQEFFDTYRKTYNHLLAHTKVQTINKFYAAKEPFNTKSCNQYKESATKFLAHVENVQTNIGRKAFRKKHNLNAKYQSLSSNCWKKTYRSGCTKAKYDANGKYYQTCGGYTEKYTCPVVTYVPTKDSVRDLAINNITQQVTDEERNCLAEKDAAPIVFARKLTAEGNFYLEKNNSGALFEDIFDGVREVLIAGIVKDAKIKKLQKIPDIKISGKHLSPTSYKTKQ